MSTRIPSPGELRDRGSRALVRELGYADALRLLLQCESGHGNYTEKRRTILPLVTAEDLTREAEAAVVSVLLVPWLLPLHPRWPLHRLRILVAWLSAPSFREPAKRGSGLASRTRRGSSWVTPMFNAH